MRKYLTQMLEEINRDPKAIANYKEDFLLKVLLPEGDPPFKAAAEPMGMTPTNLFADAKRFYIYCRKDLTNIKREALFVSMLEGVHPEEAKVILAVKDQNLGKLYPKITWKLVSDAGIIPAPKDGEVVTKPKKSKEPTGVKL